jgi:hypothetical protein
MLLVYRFVMVSGGGGGCGCGDGDDDGGELPLVPL